MIIKCLAFTIVIGLSFTEGIYHKRQTVKNEHSTSLSLDEAYLIVRNTNHSHNVTLFGNKIECESCDLTKMIVATANINATLIINTKYPYDLELRSSSLNESLLCQITSYKFAEHGTYVLEFVQDTNMCSIEQIGNPSYYMVPAIMGIVFVILYTIVVQIWSYIHYRQYFNYFRSNASPQRFSDDNLGTTPSDSPENIPQQSLNALENDGIYAADSMNKLPLVSSTHLVNSKTHIKRVLPKRLRSLDTFRGFALMVMIFVNYGGGGYWFFDHSTWNGLTIADLLFPWFTWMMGVSIVLSLRSLRSKNVRKRSLVLKICRRTIILYILGFTGQDFLATFETLRLPGVLQRLAICYFFTALIVLIFERKNDKEDRTQLSMGNDTDQPLHIELFNTIFQYWLQWFLVILIITVWLLITFLLPVPNCPTGYLGPGGKHEHGKYPNCTGGAAGYIDRIVLGSSHLYDGPTCKEIYKTKIPYDPEGIMGNLTGILLCYLGVQAGHVFVHSTRIRRICAQWFLWGIICGSLGLILSKGGHSDSWIPINKNMWSLTFVLLLSSLAFMILTVLYLLVDVYQWFTGAPFLWLGMNSIAIYIGHDRFEISFPVQMDGGNTHAGQLAVHLWGAFFWSLVAGVMYYKKIFIAI